MPTNIRQTRSLQLPDQTDRYPNNAPPDGYVLTYSFADGYYLAKPPSKQLIVSFPASTPYAVGHEDVVLVPNHTGVFEVDLPISPLVGTVIHIKDLAGVAAANVINVATSQLVDGFNPYPINTNFGAIKIVFIGASWSVLSKM